MYVHVYMCVLCVCVFHVCGLDMCACAMCVVLSPKTFEDHLNHGAYHKPHHVCVPCAPWQHTVCVLHVCGPCVYSIYVCVLCVCSMCVFNVCVFHGGVPWHVCAPCVIGVQVVWSVVLVGLSVCLSVSVWWLSGDGNKVSLYRLSWSPFVLKKRPP